MYAQRLYDTGRQAECDRGRGERTAQANEDGRGRRQLEYSILFYSFVSDAWGAACNVSTRHTLEHQSCICHPPQSAVHASCMYEYICSQSTVRPSEQATLAKLHLYALYFCFCLLTALADGLLQAMAFDNLGSTYQSPTIAMMYCYEQPPNLLKPQKRFRSGYLWRRAGLCPASFLGSLLPGFAHDERVKQP